MKNLNVFFGVLYVLIFIASAIFGINLLLKDGLGLFDDIAEMALSVIYMGALLIPAFFHFQFRNRLPTLGHKIFLTITSITCVSLVGLIYAGSTCRAEGCMGAILPMLVTLLFWGLSLVAGAVLFFSKVSTNEQQ